MIQKKQMTPLQKYMQEIKLLKRRNHKLETVIKQAVVFATQMTEQLEESCGSCDEADDYHQMIQGWEQALKGA